ncbi:hypothetical protein IFO69_19650 [Echinicola sp. CAU 1574]|uniref:Uncharacterized protein n=1 Tax=Echinicola arenosa TaxID=2774144 RepID=A0ABR9AQD1_9BACT|nr:hypothetical protein [Echinicola arenosa]MBD8490977.1 hypothetical protein [Echinicola arenosa]
MKNIYVLLVLLSISLNVLAQAPQKMSYQAVIRDTNHELVRDATIGLQISILKGSASGSIIYSETYTSNTNTNGLVSLEVGTGEVKQGIFSEIDWGNGSYFIKTETDPSGGTDYSISGTSQLLSVPFALYAENAGGLGWKVKGDTVYTDLSVLIGTSNIDDITPFHAKIPPGLSTGVAIEGSSIDKGNPSIRFYDEEKRASAIGVSLGGNGYFSRNAKLGDFVIRSEGNNIIFATNPTNDFESILIISEDENVGIGTTTPKRKLHVKDVLRLEPRNNAPENPEKGDMYMDNISNKLMVYDGTQWQSCW